MIDLCTNCSGPKGRCYCCAPSVGPAGRDVGGLLPSSQTGSDNWRHRSQGMRCGSCMFWVAKKPVDTESLTKPEKRLGRCRRHAPTLSGFPAAFDNDWCGDHKIDEEKLP